MVRGTGTVLALAAALVLALFCSPASTQSRIVVHGAVSGSHLRLTVEGPVLTVDGLMSPESPAGCHFQRQTSAVCDLRDAAGVEVEMGPQGDFVEVLDGLPVPLTVRLGDGSDKFIGNDERDTCYSEGARRNRCIGGGGDDICITGQQNSDCVGDAGDDYCKHGAGSDGCWGGPGNDICLMGPGHDGCHGEGGKDELYGGSSSDQLYGGEGYDFCDGQAGWGRSHTCEAGPGR